MTVSRPDMPGKPNNQKQMVGTQYGLLEIHIGNGWDWVSFHPFLSGWDWGSRCHILENHEFVQHW